MRITLAAGALALALAGCAGQSNTSVVTELETGLVIAEAAALVYEQQSGSDPATVQKIKDAEAIAKAAVGSLVQSVQAGATPSAAALAAAQAALAALQAVVAPVAPAVVHG